MLKQFILGHSEKFVSRWVILAKDILIVGFSLVSAYLLRYNFMLPWSYQHILLQQILVVTAMAASAFLLTRSYVGIVRHTSFHDIGLMILSMSLVALGIVAFNMAIQLLDSQTLLPIPYSVMLIFLILSVFLIVTTRLAIKLFYLYMIKRSNKPENILIFGAGRAGRITKNAIESGTSGSRVIGYIDENPGKIGKSLEGVSIYSPDIFDTDFITRRGVNEIIFAIHNIDPRRRNRIVEVLIERYKIRVKEIPPLEQWINGELTARQIKSVRIEDLLMRESIHLGNDHVVAEMRGKVVMVTGAAGSIGSELARQLCHFAARKLVFIDQAETPLYELDQEIKVKYPHLYDVCDFVIADVSNQTTINRLFAYYQPHLVFHAAAYKHVPLMEINPFEAVRVNIFGTRILADAASRHKTEKFVMVSTDKAVNPTNVMGASKRAAEMYIQSLNDAKDNKTRFITTRFGNVLGSNGSVILLFTKQIAAGGPVTVTHPDITRYFMTIPEACRLVFEAGTMGQGGEIFVFDMGEPVRITDLAKKMIRLSGLEPGKDIEIKYVGLRPGEKIYEELLNDQEKCLPTHHPKITIAQVRNFTFEEVLAMFSDLQRDVQTNNRMVMVASLKRMIPEFISKNSVYEDLDIVPAHVETDR